MEMDSEIILLTTGEPLRFYSVEHWRREWLKGKELAKSEDTFVKYEPTIKSFSFARRARKAQCKRVQPQRYSTLSRCSAEGQQALALPIPGFVR